MAERVEKEKRVRNQGVLKTLGDLHVETDLRLATPAQIYLVIRTIPFRTCYAH